MTDPDLVAKKLALIEHTLQIAIQAAMDVASHLVSDLRLGEPRTNRELFDLLARGNVIATDLASWSMAIRT